MSEIPEDIMKISDNLAACSVSDGIGRDILSGNIARAILAEREASAKIAEQAALQSYSPHQHPMKIAAAIRRR